MQIRRFFQKIEEYTGFSGIKWMHFSHIFLWFGIGLLVSRSVSLAAFLALAAGFCGIIYAMRKE